eukprot:TRINITY_DN38028_c0_g1_i1.p1 TRINITY_DN38028_c0_g1~~TRINITY_DN38028_c0_g1_i1.p1  ORF type:complete len:320 (+),score=45.02 TRINITY_DN38028_c0_g1_i1:48-962(+)
MGVAVQAPSLSPLPPHAGRAAAEPRALPTPTGSAVGDQRETRSPCAAAAASLAPGDDRSDWHCIPLSSAEGQRLADSMPPAGRATLSRWLRAWEPQEQGHFCAPASMLAALRMLDDTAAAAAAPAPRAAEAAAPRAGGGGQWRTWTQQRIYDEVVIPRGLFTQGVSFEHGTELARAFAGRTPQHFHVEQRWSTDPMLLARQLRADLEAAFHIGSSESTSTRPCGHEVCLLANYLRHSGGGHWSPLGGLVGNFVLILDTNDRKSSPHWVPLRWLAQSMAEHNSITKRPRGYLWLSRSSAPAAERS